MRDSIDYRTSVSKKVDFFLISYLKGFVSTDSLLLSNYELLYFVSMLSRSLHVTLLFWMARSNYENVCVWGYKKGVPKPV